MARPYIYSKLGDKVDINSKSYQLCTTATVYGIVSLDDEWIIETKRHDYGGSEIKYIKPFYPTLRQAQRQRDKYIERYGQPCKVVELNIGDTHDGEKHDEKTNQEQTRQEEKEEEK